MTLHSDLLCLGISSSATLRPSVSSHLAYDAVLHVCLLVAALFAHQCDLQLAERFRQDVTLGEELPPLNNVGLQQRCVVLVAQHPLPLQKLKQ